MVIKVSEKDPLICPHCGKSVIDKGISELTEGGSGTKEISIRDGEFYDGPTLLDNLNDCKLVCRACQGELEDEETAIPYLLELTVKNKKMGSHGYDLWVKKLGQMHYTGKDGKGKTLCGSAMLGNNYARTIPLFEMKPCEVCSEKAKGLLKTIVVVIEGGVIQEIGNIPHGHKVEVRDFTKEDYDEEDLELIAGTLAHVSVWESELANERSD